VPEWVAAVVAVVGLVGMFSGAYAVSKERGIKDTMEAYRVGNQELRLMNDDLRNTVEDNEQRCRERASEQDRQIAHLRGQIETLQSGVVTTLVTELSTTLKAELTSAVHAALLDPDRRKGAVEVE